MGREETNPYPQGVTYTDEWERDGKPLIMDSGVTEARRRAYHDAGAPYGSGYLDFMRWIQEHNIGRDGKPQSGDRTS